MKRIFLLSLLCLVIYGTLGMVDSMEASTTNWHKEEIVVHSGDTLWSIASYWTGQGEDVREVICRIQDENDLIGKGYLQPGQRLLVPVRVPSNQLARR